MNKYKNLLSHNIRELIYLFSRKYNYHGAPTIDTIDRCFGLLNMDRHLCISEKETFFMNKKFILRPHCSNFQSYCFDQYKDISIEVQSRGFYNAFEVGTVFRRDDSARHSYFFHQCDILIFKKKIDPIEEINNLMELIQEFIGKSITYRIRESFFPFTFPSYEVDLLFEGKYIEILGCGVTHHDILNKMNIPANSVFAAGIGIERLIMIKERINNIKIIRII